MVNNLQNPHGISNVRVSGSSVLNFADLEAVKIRNELMDSLRYLKLGHRLGSSDKPIRLTGDDGVQAHIKMSDAYVFFGKPNLSEALKFVSLFVGLQTLDPDLHYQPESLLGTHDMVRRPLIVYGDPTHYLPLIGFIQHLHEKLGTVRQEPYSLIRMVGDDSNLGEALFKEVAAQASIHGGGADPEKIAEAVKFYTENTKFSPVKKIVKPDFSAVAYTSASKNSDAAYEIAYNLAKSGIGGVSGAGATGSMGDFARGGFEAGGYQWGANCPHIAAQEGLPGMGSAFPHTDEQLLKLKMEVLMTPDIYSRMYEMKSQADAIICGTGGFGGTGTVQEMLAGFLLIMERSPVMTKGKNAAQRAKPIILDNSQGMWEGIDKVLEPFGLHAGRDYFVASSSQEVLDYVGKARSGELNVKIPSSVHAHRQ